MPWHGGDGDPGAFPTLGFAVIDWIEANLIVPDGARRGEPFLLTPEQQWHIMKSYQLKPHARSDMGSQAFTYYGSLLVRPQKSGKDPLAAAQACAQALGPVRFAGWDASGEPVGSPMPTPWIQCAANSEDQVGNTFSPIFTMLSEGPAANTPGLDVGLTRVNLPDGGRIEPVTAAAKSRLGARITFATFTEALAISTPIPTPTGWTTMGSVNPGDMVLGADGLPARVIKATEIQDDRLCYRVTFRDGTSLIASDGHQWLTRITGHPQKHTIARVRTTAEMVADGRKMSIPVAPPVKSPDVELPIDPYVLGLWLGDGSNKGALITMGDQDRDELIELVRARGYTAEHRTSESERFGVYVSVPGSVKGRWGGHNGRPLSLVTLLRQQVLLNNKHIPSLYLRAGTEQRLELLRGLMDSDGCATKTGYVFFAQNSRQLVDDFYELVRSLGQVATVKWSADAKSRQGGGWRVGFQPRWGVEPFNLQRKTDRVRPRGHRDGWTTIASIEPVATEPVRCIAVDSADHLFLAGHGWHATHNSGLYTESSGGVTLARTMKRGLAGMDGRWMELTNAYDPSERSVAQRTWEAKAPGVFLDYRQPRVRVDLDDDQALRAELVYVYGDSAIENGGWVRIERIMDEIRDPSTGEGESRRFYLNEVTVGSRDAVDMIKWTAQRDSSEPLQKRQQVALGFHGSQNRDATSLCASRLSDGRIYHLRTWERAPGESEWTVPREEVHQAVRDAFKAFQVEAMFCTPTGWQTEVNVWDGQYPKKVYELWTNSELRMDQLVERFQTAHRGDELTHDGTEILTMHAAGAALANGKRRSTAEERVPGQPEHYQRIVKKSHAQSISAFMAALLAYEARGWAIEHGSLAKRKVPNLW